MAAVAVPLTQGLYAQVDEEDLPLLAGRTWSVYARAGCNYARSKTNNAPIFMHRLLLSAKPGQIVDHIDGDGLNNTRANIRLCSHTENMQNRSIASHNKCGFKGVYWDSRRNKFRADVRANGRRYVVGQFDTAEAAFAAYQAKARELHGEFFASARTLCIHEPLYGRLIGADPVVVSHRDEASLFLSVSTSQNASEELS